MLDVLLEALLDTAKMAPFLFAAYLLIEYLEHKSAAKIAGALSNGKYGVLGGAVFGCIPQCGVSVAAAHLFSGGLIGAGTLIAVFISTSDEAIPVILANPSQISKLMPLILIKVAFAVFAGYLFDAVFKRKEERFEHHHEEEHCAECQSEQEKIHGHDCGCGCEHNIFIASLKRTLSVLLLIFLLTFAVGLVIYFIGEERMRAVLMQGSIFQPVIAALVGLIPNCAASVVLTELYLEGTLSFGAVAAGLSTGAGLGLAALFKANKSMKENFLILAFIFIISILFGMILQLIL